jgi:hypothetical protein
MKTRPPPSMNVTVQQRLHTVAAVGGVGKVEAVAAGRMQRHGPLPQRPRTPCGLGAEPMTVDANGMGRCAGPAALL